MLPEILERREPNADEAAQMVGYTLAYYDYEGEWPSIGHLVREVYAGKEDKVRRSGARTCIEKAKRMVGQEFGGPTPTQAPPPMPTEEEELLELIRSGAITVSAASGD